MTSATVPGYEVLIGCVVVMLALWVWMAIHFRNIIADELPTRLRRSLRIHFWRKKSGSSEYEAVLLSAIILRVQKIRDCEVQIKQAKVLEIDDLGLRSLYAQGGKAWHDFHRLRDAMRWEGIETSEDPSNYVPSYDLPAA
jgi:hypothetical protein